MRIPIKVNYVKAMAEAGTTLGQVCRDFEPNADVLIYNGVLTQEDHTLVEGDEVIVIRRGAPPSLEEMEAAFVSRHGPDIHEKVKQARVGVAGVGGLGSHVAVALTRLGLRRLVLADFDVVEPSNLNRQQYFVDQLGVFKVDALSKTLRRINPYIELETHRVKLDAGNVPRIFSSCDVLVETFDRADQKEMLIASALAELPQICIVGGSGLAGYGPVDDIKTLSIGPRLFIVGDLVSEAGPDGALRAPRVGAAAHAQANLVLRLILGVEESG